MAFIPDKKTFVQGVGIIVKSDTTIMDLLFPTKIFHDTKEIEYDMTVIEGETVEFNSFANQSDTIIKDGKSVVKITMPNMNNSISKDELDANRTKFNQNAYGEGSENKEVESAMNDVGRIKLFQDATLKAMMYNSITIHQIPNGYEDRDGKHDIVFAVPAVNKVVFDGTTAGQEYWSNANSKPLTNLLNAYNAMIVKPSYVIVNSATFGNFIKNAEVIKTGNHLTEPQNFFRNETIVVGAEAYRAGRIEFNGMIVDMYVEKQSKKSGTPFMPDGYVVLTSSIGEIHYAGIPIAQKGVGVTNIAAEWDANEVITEDPPVHKIVIRTAPCTVLKNGEGYYSMKVEA